MLKNNKIIGLVLFLVLLISCYFYFHGKKEVTQNSPTNNINKKEIKENNKVDLLPIKKREIIVFEFIDFNKRLYFKNIDLKEIKIIKGKKEILVEKRNYIDDNVQLINLTGQYELKYKNIDISVNDNIFINNISMENNINAVIDEKEKISIGSFIAFANAPPKTMTPEDEIMIKKMREEIKQNILRTNDPVQIEKMYKDLKVIGEK